MSLLCKLGSIINLEKSDLTPTKQFTFLSLHWDSIVHSMTFTGGKFSKLCSSDQHLLQPSTVSCKEVQKFLGLTNFAAFAVPRVHLHSRSIQQDFSLVYKSHLHASRTCPISKVAAQELQWWANLTTCSKLLSPPLPSQSIATDTSHSRWGASSGNCQKCRQWNA